MTLLLHVMRVPDLLIDIGVVCACMFRNSLSNILQFDGLENILLARARRVMASRPPRVLLWRLAALRAALIDSFIIHDQMAHTNHICRVRFQRVISRSKTLLQRVENASCGDTSQSVNRQDVCNPFFPTDEAC
jgi:hypothetical protein